MTYWTQLLGHPFTVEQFDAKGRETRALVMGKGEPVIFLHGVSGHLEAFIPVAPHLADKYELHLIDMIGHGFTHKPKGDFDIRDMAAHVIDYMDARGIAKAHLVGISMGGWVCGWLISHYPDRFLGSILIAAAGNPAMANSEVSQYVRKITIDSVMSDDREDTVKRLRAVMFKPESVDKELVDTRYHFYHMPEFRANLEGLLSTGRPENYVLNALTGDALANVTCEVLLCWGEDDKYSGIADAKFLTDYLPKAKLIQMNNTGHWPPYERPADFAKIADAFFQKGLDAITEGPQ